MKYFVIEQINIIAMNIFGASLSKPHTSGTALQDVCICLRILKILNEGTRAFQFCTCAKAF